MSDGPQDQWEQIDAFSFEINEKIEYYNREFDIPMESMVGVLEVAKNDLINQATITFEQDNDDDD
tara:strand:+ start:122 stop:316 length:195 start_codon:yes stop_codon:yes gene_type:complete